MIKKAKAMKTKIINKISTPVLVFLISESVGFSIPSVRRLSPFFRIPGIDKTVRRVSIEKFLSYDSNKGELP
jgi:hypothetical protein